MRRYDARVNDVYLGLGTNLGDRIANLREALSALEQHVAVANKSSVYESLPQGVGEQPLYLNMVVEVSTTLTPHALLAAVKAVESARGRAPHSHNLPRPIDIDILMYGECVVSEEDLTIPHPALHERAFVLVPLEEIAALHMHPTRGRSIIDLLDALGGYDALVWRAEHQL